MVVVMAEQNNKRAQRTLDKPETKMGNVSYKQLNIVARSRNVCTSSAITTASYHFTRRELLWRFIVAGDNKTYIRLQAKRPVFLPNFNKICHFYSLS
jgi:hypothetical protein